MNKNLDNLIADPSFRERASAMCAGSAPSSARPLGDMFEHVRRFAAVRLREVRISLLIEAGRTEADDWQSHRDRVPDAVSAIGAAVKMLSEDAHALRPLITPALDEVIALASDAGHPLHKMLEDKALELGFTRKEAAWLFNELEAIDYRPVQLICASGFEDLAALLAGISVGEGGLLLAGFVRFTGDPDTDQRLEQLVVRLRKRGVTASVFLVLVIVLTANAVARL